jgi:hypothetical protein
MEEGGRYNVGFNKECNVRQTDLRTEKLVRKADVRERYNHEVKRYEATRFGSRGGQFFDCIEKN